MRKPIITEAPSALIVGATGRIGGFLRAGWRQPPDQPSDQQGRGFSPIWQTRADPAAKGWVRWDPLGAAPMPTATVVLGLAGVIRGDAAALALNTTLALRLCEAARAAGVRHVFLTSSAAVYGPTETSADEDATPDPRSPYGVAKLAMERAAKDWCDAAGPDAPGLTVLRIGNVAGGDMLLRNAARGRVRLDAVPGQPGGPVRSYIGPLTLARVLGALVARAASGAELPGILNVATPEPVAMANLLAAQGSDFDWADATPATLPRVVMSTRRLERLVPFSARDSRPEAMIEELRSLDAAAPRTVGAQVIG